MIGPKLRFHTFKFELSRMVQCTVAASSSPWSIKSTMAASKDGYSSILDGYRGGQHAFSFQLGVAHLLNLFFLLDNWIILEYLSWSFCYVEQRNRYAGIMVVISVFLAELARFVPCSNPA